MWYTMMKFKGKNGGFAMRQWISKRQAAIGPNTQGVRVGDRKSDEI